MEVLQCYTMLMWVCEKCTTLLDQKFWFVEKLLEQDEIRKQNTSSAFELYAKSRGIDLNIHSPSYNYFSRGNESTKMKLLFQAVTIEPRLLMKQRLMRKLIASISDE